MNISSTEIFDAALALPDSERLALVNKLWSSLCPPHGLSEDDPDFAEKLAARLNDSGAETIDGDEALQILRARQRTRSSS